MLSGTCLGGWSTGGTLGSSVILHSPSNLPFPAKHSWICWIKSCLSVMVAGSVSEVDLYLFVDYVIKLDELELLACC